MPLDSPTCFKQLQHLEQEGAVQPRCDRTGVGSIPAGGPIVDEFFSTVPG